MLSFGQCQHPRSLVAMLIGRLGRHMQLDLVAAADRPAGLRLDVGVLDEARLVHDLDDVGRAGESRRDVAALNAAIGQDVAGTVRMQLDRALDFRRVDARYRRQRLIGNRHFGIVDCRQDCRGPDERNDRLAAIAHDAVRQHRLILDVGIDAVAVVRHVGGGQHGEAGISRRQVGHIARS